MRWLTKYQSFLSVCVFTASQLVSAQIVKGRDFTTTFPFFAANEKMPAGSYRITETNLQSTVLEIRSTDGNHFALIQFVPTHSSTLHAHSDITFLKYGDTEYLNMLWVGGQNYGMKIAYTTAQRRLAAKMPSSEQLVPGTSP